MSPRKLFSRKPVWLLSASFLALLLATVGYLIGARVGFDRGQEQQALANQDLRVRQVLFALWAMAEGDEIEARNRLDLLLEMYLEDRVRLFGEEPFLLAEDYTDAFPLLSYLPGQLDKMIYDHLTDPRYRITGHGAIRTKLTDRVGAEKRQQFIERYPAILEHTAALIRRYHAGLLTASGELLLHESVDGAVVLRLDAQQGVDLEYVGGASIGKGGILWGRYRVPSGESGYISLHPDDGVVGTLAPVWRRWLAILPGY